MEPLEAVPHRAFAAVFPTDDSKPVCIFVAGKNVALADQETIADSTVAPRGADLQRVDNGLS